MRKTSRRVRTSGGALRVSYSCLAIVWHTASATWAICLVPGTSQLGAGLQRAPSTTSAPPVGQTTTALSQNIQAAAGGGASTVTLNPVTWVQPVQNVGGAVVGHHSTVSTAGGAGGPSTLQCAQGTPRQRKSSPRGTPTTKGKRNTSTSNSCLESNTKSQAAQSRGGPITGHDNTAPNVRGCSVPITRKGVHRSTKQRKPWVRATTSQKRNLTSSDVHASPGNPSPRGRPAESTGSAPDRKDNARPTIAASGVPTTQKCSHTRGSPGHTTALVTPACNTTMSTCNTNSVLQPTTTCSLLPPSTCGTPAQTGQAALPAFHQDNSAPPDANSIDDIVAMMAALSISKRPQKTCRLPGTDTGGARGISTTSSVTGNAKGPPSTQTTRSAPNHSTDGAIGGSAKTF
ncbi:mucin-5AC-like [Mustela putorius furo]|uniref:Mucin-5AC-like n=1 Tax=Mustela putorius furo TaxID=9669 RepID=A0A8U0V8G3_MUSPF|nr:mucin-5AC-like [Mustela putorius furo]